METLALSLNKPNDLNALLKSYVLCSGIQYGNGETTFYEHFK
jgi:hypothetical protein